MGAESVRKVMICANDNLAKVAKDIGVTPAVALDTKEYWNRRLEGRCIYCGKVSKTEVCAKCASGGLPDIAKGLKVAHEGNIIGLLEEMDSYKEVISRVCANCKTEKMLSVDYVLEMYRRYGPKFFRKRWYCKPCLREVVQKQHEKLTHKPFKALKGLEPVKSEKPADKEGIRIMAEESQTLTKEDVMSNTATKKKDQEQPQNVTEISQEMLEELMAAAGPGMIEGVSELIKARKSKDPKVRKAAKEWARNIVNLEEAGMGALPSLAHKIEYNTDYVSTGVTVGKGVLAVGAGYAVFQLIRDQILTRF